MLPESDRARLDPSGLDILNPYINEARYPLTDEPLGREEAEAAVAIARRVREAVRAALPSSALGVE